MATLRVYMSTNTSKVIDKATEAAIKKYCKKYMVEEALVRAIKKQESMDFAYAIRYEDHLRRAKWYQKLIPEKYKKDKFAYCSMGYLQVLYGIARDYGFEGTPHELFTPDNSILYGVLHIKELIRRYYRLDKVVSAYNQGSPRVDRKTGKFKNQAYVNAVLKNYRRFGGKIQ